MRWTRGHRSDHVQDRRGQGGGGFARGGGAMLPLFRLAAMFGPKGILLFLAALVAFFFLSGGPSRLANVGGDEAPITQDDPAVKFVSFVLDDVQATWARELGPRYRPTDLVFYTGAIDTECGFGVAATGPFYCPTDQQVYIDLSFYSNLARRFGAPGDFAQAYVIAHEVGHHVQHLTGVAERAHGAGAEGGSVRLELRPIATRGSGPTAPRSASSWRRATSRRPSPRPPPSATTACSAKPRARSTRTPSRTARRPSARVGSAAATRQARSTHVTRSEPRPSSTLEGLIQTDDDEVRRPQLGIREQGEEEGAQEWFHGGAVYHRGARTHAALP